VVVCDDSQKALHLMNNKSNLEYIVVIDAISDEARHKADELNIKLMTFEELKETGLKNLKRPIVIRTFLKGDFCNVVIAYSILVYKLINIFVAT
jgi:hypothetical protein